MFKLRPDPTFWSRYEITVPGGETAGTIELELECTYLSRSQYQAQIEAPGLTVNDAVLLLVRGWRQPGGGELEPFTVERFGEFLDDYQVASTEIFEQYLRHCRASKRKN